MDKKTLLYVTLLCMAAGLGSGQMLDHMLSPWSYHVCNHTVTVNVSKVVAFQKSREEATWCMSWISRKLCTQTTYQTQYRTVYVPETSAVKRCCEGYEPVGRYCALSLERSRVYASRPGICPDIEDKERGPNCTSDYDCPGLQKCCVSSNGSFCASPAPPALDRNTITYWYNGSVIIKMGYEELIRWDDGFVNHTRLLHSMVTGEFWPLEAVVYHLSTKPAGTFSITSSVLIGINESLSLTHIAVMLNNIVIRVPEVISIQIHDVNECLHPALGRCLSDQDCVNLEGSYNCSNKSSSHSIHQTTTHPDCSMFYNHSVTHVTSSGFILHWNTDCPENYTYNVQVSSMGFRHSKTIWGTTMGIHELQAGELYTVQVMFADCNGLVQLWNGRVKTEAHVLNGTVKINNWNLTDSLLNPNSTDYTDFVRKFTSEVKNSLSNEIPPERVTVEVESLSAGSVIVNFRIIVNDSEKPVNITAASFSAFSDAFQVDPQSIVVTDFNECLTPADNDCHLHADCKNLDRSYTCECHPSFIDRDPIRPGRNCEGVAPSPDSSSFEQVGPLLPPMESVDPTTGGSSTSPIGASPPATPQNPGSPTNVTRESPEISHAHVERSSPANPITPEAKVPSSAQSILSPPVPASSPINTTAVGPVLTTSHKTAPNTTNSTENVTAAKISAPGIGTSTPKAMPPSTGDKGIVTPVPVPTRQMTSREMPCSFPIVGANIESTHMPHLSSARVKVTTQKSPGLTLKDASIVSCVMGKIGIFIEKAFLKMMSITSHSLFLGSPACSINCSTDTHIFIEAGWKDCNTDVDSNQTHIVVNSTLYIDLSSTFQNVTPKAISSIRCVFLNEILWSSGYNPAGGIYTIIENLESNGTFLPEFQLFIGDQPIPPNFTLSATDDITVQIRIKEEGQYKVVISECWATPTENTKDPISFPFIKDSCALTNTFTTILSNGVSTNATFQTKIFSFVENPIVYLHCRLHVCNEQPFKTCKPTCNGLRSANTGDNVYTGVTRMGPLRKTVKSHNSDSSSSSTLGPGYIALIVIGVLVLVAMVVSILIFWHERRTGNYNFKIKTKDVDYQVFSN
ncbi:uromodulin-like 1 [Rhinoderma darwinii]|uniref:uromodulin-like 1 n=1 Tax=Rhinoderma darwinii TaxID=43563 RepID=UPI003F67B12D